MRAWHFVDEYRKLGYGDGRVAAAGWVYRHTGKLELCKSGLHASINSWDALSYAPGPVVCRVECGGEVIRGDDKLVCTERKVLWIADASEVLFHFARLCALDVVDLWDASPDVKRFLRTGGSKLRRWVNSGLSFIDAHEGTNGSRSATLAAKYASSTDPLEAVYAAYYARNALGTSTDKYSALREKQQRRLARMLMELGRREAKRV